MSFSVAKDEVSLEQASETIRKESKGQVISATTSIQNGVKSHRIKVLTKSGRVKVYNIPASKKATSKNFNNRYDQPKKSNSFENYRSKTPDNSSKNLKNPSTKNPQPRSSNNRNSPARINPSRNNSSRNQPTKSRNTSKSNGDNKKK